MSAFSVVAVILYVVDLKLIKRRKNDFDVSESKKELYKHILGEQTQEMKTIVPAGLVFNGLCFYLIYRFPEVFIFQGYHLVLVSLQVLVTAWVIIVSVQSFKKRSRLISECI